MAISLLDSGGLSTPRYKNNTSSDNKETEYRSAEKTLETAVATAKGHVTVEKSWYGGTPTEDVNAWTVWQHRTFLLSKPWWGGCSNRVKMPAHRSRCLTRIRSPASPSVTVQNPVPDVHLANYSVWSPARDSYAHSHCSVMTAAGAEGGWGRDKGRGWGWVCWRKRFCKLSSDLTSSGGNMILPVWQLIQRAWLDLGTREPLDSKIHPDILKEKLRLLPVNGVSEEIDTDGSVKSRFNYWQAAQPTGTTYRQESKTDSSTVMPEPGIELEMIKVWEKHWVLIEEKEEQVGSDKFWINKGFGTTQPFGSLPQFAEFVEKEWETMYGDGATCPHCGEQFLPSMLEKHLLTCRSVPAVSLLGIRLKNSVS